MYVGPEPPIAKKVDHVHRMHGDDRYDPYHWLSDRNNPEVVDYLEQENLYVEQKMGHTQQLQEMLYKEMRGRIVPTEFSAPVPYKSYEYFYRENEGENYKIHFRRKRAPGSSDELLLDENVLAKSHSYFSLDEIIVNPGENLLGYSYDTTGKEQYTIRLLNLETGQLLPDVIEDVSGTILWSGDSKAIFYTRLNQAHRPWQLYRHWLGDDPDADELIFQEEDEAFYLWIDKTDSERFITIRLASNNTTEIHLLDANEQNSVPRLIFPRQYDVKYRVEDRQDDLYVLTNENARNYRLMKTRLNQPDRSTWTTVIEQSKERTLTGMQMFKNFIAVGERAEGLARVRILPGHATDSYLVPNPDKIQELRIGANEEFDTNICRLNGNALDMPRARYDFDMNTRSSILVKMKEVRGGYNPSDYATEQHFAISEDGEKVPLYLVYNQKINRQSPAPLLLNGYGSYGHAYPLHFSANRLSLLDRGVIWALAHIRGGSEKGREWYYDGKLKNKKNTFLDFTACARYLIDEKVTTPEQLAISGGSAGGLVVGNFLNHTPQWCAAAVAHVPFVDIVTTILDDSLPLSVIERDEWGDPNDKSFYDYMKSYSPYDNVRVDHFPALFVTAGLNDPRVGFWEPAKWVAKIRACKTDENPLLLKTDMYSGHAGKSGRHEVLREIALEFAFLLDQIAPK